MSYDDEIEEGPRSFARFIEMVGDGSAHEELSEELHELARHLGEEAANRGSKLSGQLTVTIKLSVEPDGIVSVDYGVRTKRPEPRRRRGVLWLTPGGNLTPENPRQQVLPLREVGGEVEVREAASKRRMKEV